MYWTIGIFDFANSYHARNAMNNEQDMHRSVMRMFNGTRAEESVLYRIIENGQKYKILIQSENAPNIQEGRKGGIIVTATRCIDEKLEQIQKGSIINLNMRLSPSRTEKREGWTRSKRVGIKKQSGRITWVKEKLEKNGCFVVKGGSVTETRTNRVKFAHKENKADVPAYEYRACVQVEDVDKFLDALKTGIGSEKAYGLGLLMFA